MMKKRDWTHRLLSRGSLTVWVQFQYSVETPNQVMFVAIVSLCEAA